MITLLQATPPPSDVIQQFFQMVLDDVNNKRWWPLASLAIVGFVAATRSLVPKWHTGLGNWFNTDRGGLALNAIWAVLGAIATTISAWKAPDWKLLVTTIFVTLGSIASYTAVKKGFFPGDKPATPTDTPMPVVLNDIAKPISPPPPVRPGMLLPFFILLSLSLSGCYCWQAAHEQEPKCVAAHQVVNCTEDALAAVLPYVIPIVSDLITGSNPDWNSVEQRLEAAGFANGGCILTALENDFLTKAQASPEQAANADAALHKLKMHFNAMDVKFCFKPKGATQAVCK